MNQKQSNVTLKESKTETEVIEEDYEQIPPEDTRYAYSPNSTFER